MQFDNLNSQVIKAGIVSKLAFSLGFKLISATLKAQRPQQLDFNTGELDFTPQEEAQLAKRRWATFVEWAATYEYKHSTIEEIAEKYVLSSGKPVQAVSPEILKLRAQVSGKSIAELTKQAEAQMLITQQKVQYQINKVISDFNDITEYANGFYNRDRVAQDGTLVHSSVDIEEVITEAWLIDAYQNVLKSQINFWNRFGNWDDAELILIAEDKQILGL